jgi:hypothetical protein
VTLGHETKQDLLDRLTLSLDDSFDVGDDSIELIGEPPDVGLYGLGHRRSLSIFNKISA